MPGSRGKVIARSRAPLSTNPLPLTLHLLIYHHTANGRGGIRNGAWSTQCQSHFSKGFTQASSVTATTVFTFDFGRIFNTTSRTSQSRKATEGLCVGGMVALPETARSVQVAVREEIQTSRQNKLTDICYMFCVNRPEVYTMKSLSADTKILHNYMLFTHD